MAHNERLYWLGFSAFRGIGPARFQLLLKKFWTAENAWHANEAELKHSGIGLKISEAFLVFRVKFDLEKYAQSLEAKEIKFLTLSERAYPQLLAQSINPPFILYTKGNLDLTQFVKRKPLAVVGTRKITDYGRQVTRTLVHEIASAGCVIVSGLAMGVDALAHTAALEAGGLTIAVLGCGVDCCYPQENTPIYAKILKNNGLIVSEFPPGMPPQRGSFPSRNRIIAGLSYGVLVTEGAKNSGSLITAEQALKNNRKVFAVPGPITSSVSCGPISLISAGATLVASAQDVLKGIAMHPSHALQKTQGKVQASSAQEQVILDLLADEQLHFDELVKRTGLSPSMLGSLLSLMEVKGMIEGLDNGVFHISY